MTHCRLSSATSHTFNRTNVELKFLKDCDGMTGHYYPGDIIDLPERRFKSLRLRGLVDEYKGNSGTTRER